MKHLFNPSATQPVAATNESAAATAYITGIQAAFARESLILTVLAMDTLGTLSEGVHTSCDSRME